MSTLQQCLAMQRDHGGKKCLRMLSFQLLELLCEAAQQLVPIPPVDPLTIVIIITDRPTASPK